MDAWVTVVIPTITQAESAVALARSLFPQLETERIAGRVEVLDNGHLLPGRDLINALDVEGVLHGAPVSVWDTRGMLLYRQWNLGLKIAQYRRRTVECPLFAVVLNDDLEVPPNLVEALVAPMLADESVWLTHVDERAKLGSTSTGRLTPTTGSYRHGGLTGWAWAVRVAPLADGRIPPIDERLKIWGGDDDIAFAVQRAGGRQVRVDGLGVSHSGELSCRADDLWPFVERHKWNDVALVHGKWGR